jgi:hypothetical protein
VTERVAVRAKRMNKRSRANLLEIRDVCLQFSGLACEFLLQALACNCKACILLGKQLLAARQSGAKFGDIGGERGDLRCVILVKIVAFKWSNVLKG